MLLGAISSKGHGSKCKERRQNHYKIVLTHGFHTSTSINIPHNINWGNKINHVTNITKRKEGREGEWEVNSTHTKSTYIFTKFISKMNRITFII